MYLTLPQRRVAGGRKRFTTDNSEFGPDREILNEALDILLADVPDDDRAAAEKTYSDLLNNAWHEGITVDELVAAVRAAEGA